MPDGLTGPGVFAPLIVALNTANQVQTFNTAGASAVIFRVSGTYTGSISFGNSEDGSTDFLAPSRLSVSGYGSSGRATITGDGTASNKQYRANAGGLVFVAKAGADFSGSVTITLYATAPSPITLIGGSVHTSDEEALRAGRAYTTSTGVGTVASGNSMVLYLSNPAGSGKRVFIKDRIFTATREDNLTAVGPQFYGISSPTGNIPAGNAVVSNRGDGTVTSALVAKFAVVNAANLPSGGTTGAGNLSAGGQFNLTLERTLEPGKAFAQVMTNTSSGALGGAFNILMTITAGFYEEPI